MDVVVIVLAVFILPNPVVIEPLAKLPTVFINPEPSLGAYVVEAVVESNLESSDVLMLDVTLAS